MVVIDSLQDVVRELKRGARPMLLYSGGIDSAYMAKVVAAHSNRGVAFHVDLGSICTSARRPIRVPDERLSFIEEDGRVEFVRDFVVPALKANPLYFGAFPVSASISRPMLTQRAVARARELGCDMLLHTSLAVQNSIRRFNQSIRALGFEGLYGSPFAKSSPSRSEKLRALDGHGWTALSSDVSIDENVWCREFEGGEYDNPECDASFEKAMVFRSGNVTQDTLVEVEFDAGEPQALNGNAMTILEIVNELNRIGGPYRVGRYVGLEENQCGLKYLEIREMPAAAILLFAYQMVECGSVPEKLLSEKQAASAQWISEVNSGNWFGAKRMELQGRLDDIARQVGGTAVMRVRAFGTDWVRLVCREPLYRKSRESSSS